MLDMAKVDEAIAVTSARMVVACYLGHCGAEPNRYEVTEGSAIECRAFMRSLPLMQEQDYCCYCGSYTGTVPMRETCAIEVVD